MNFGFFSICRYLRFHSIHFLSCLFSSFTTSYIIFFKSHYFFSCGFFSSSSSLRFHSCFLLSRIVTSSFQVSHYLFLLWLFFSSSSLLFHSIHFIQFLFSLFLFLFHGLSLTFSVPWLSQSWSRPLFFLNHHLHKYFSFFQFPF